MSSFPSTPWVAEDLHDACAAFLDRLSATPLDGPGRQAQWAWAELAGRVLHGLRDAEYDRDDAFVRHVAAAYDAAVRSFDWGDDDE